MPKVFLSFIHEDRRIADALKSLVEHELGICKEVFMVTDQDHLRAGDNWLGTIENALKSSEIVLSLLSKRSITKPGELRSGSGLACRQACYSDLHRQPEERGIRGRSHAFL